MLVSAIPIRNEENKLDKNRIKFREIYLPELLAGIFFFILFPRLVLPLMLSWMRRRPRTKSSNGIYILNGSGIYAGSFIEKLQFGHFLMLSVLSKSCLQTGHRSFFSTCGVRTSTLREPFLYTVRPFMYGNFHASMNRS